MQICSDIYAWKTFIFFQPTDRRNRVAKKLRGRRKCQVAKRVAVKLCYRYRRPMCSLRREMVCIMVQYRYRIFCSFLQSLRSCFALYKDVSHNDMLDPLFTRIPVSCLACFFFFASLLSNRPLPQSSLRLSHVLHSIAYPPPPIQRVVAAAIGSRVTTPLIFLIGETGFLSADIEKRSHDLRTKDIRNFPFASGR